MMNIKKWKKEISEKRQYKKELKALKTYIDKQEKELAEKDELISYYMDKFHTYKSKCIELRREIMELKKNG